MEYILAIWDRKNLSYHPKVINAKDVDAARKAACKLILDTYDRNYPRVVIRAKGFQGEVEYARSVFPGGSMFNYVSTSSKDGIIWKVNPNNGKLTTKIGYVD